MSLPSFRVHSSSQHSRTDSNDGEFRGSGQWYAYMYMEVQHTSLRTSRKGRKATHTNTISYEHVSHAYVHNPLPQFSRQGTQASYSLCDCMFVYIHVYLFVVLVLDLGFLSSLSLRLLAVWCAIHMYFHIYTCTCKIYIKYIQKLMYTSMYMYIVICT